MSANVRDGLVANFARNLDLCPHRRHILPRTAEQPVLHFLKKHAFGFLEGSILLFVHSALLGAHRCLSTRAKAPTFGMLTANGTLTFAVRGAL